MSARGGAQETGSLAERLAEELEQEILRQRMDAGARFGLRSTLIERYAVSANVMNEALRILRDRGVVTVRPGPQGGVFVAHPPPQLRLGAIDLWFRGLHVDPAELFEARTLLEESLAVVAGARATPEDVRDLQWSLAELRDSRADARGYLEANMRLHGVIARAARVPVLAGMYESICVLLRSALVRAEYVAEGHAAIIEHNIGVHAALCDAIGRGDVETLRAVLDDHRTDLVRAPRP